MKNKRLYHWPCGHKTDISYKHWPNCPVCCLINNKFRLTLYQLEREQKKETERNIKESNAFSKAFNRQGCKYCGGI